MTRLALLRPSRPLQRRETAALALFALIALAQGWTGAAITHVLPFVQDDYALSDAEVFDLMTVIRVTSLLAIAFSWWGDHRGRRMPLLLANVERLPLKDSAAVMGLKLNSLKTRLHRANLLVKKDLTAYFQDKEQREVKEDKKCGAWTGFFYDYAHGLMDNRRSQLFKEHIRDCPGCNGFLDTYGQAIKVTGALACHDLPQELKKRIETFLSLGHLKQKSRKESDNG